MATIRYQDKDLTLVQDPYISLRGDLKCNVYIASALDEEGEEYEAEWEITNPDAEDESDACDWTRFTVRKI